MTNNEQEMREIIKNNVPAIVDMLTVLAENLLKKQKDDETRKYANLLVSPGEAAEIVVRQGGAPFQMIEFALDAIRYYHAELDGSAASNALFIAGFLVEAGRIIGIRQERAKKAN